VVCPGTKGVGRKVFSSNTWRFWKTLFLKVREQLSGDQSSLAWLIAPRHQQLDTRKGQGVCREASRAGYRVDGQAVVCVSPTVVEAKQGGGLFFRDAPQRQHVVPGRASGDIVFALACFSFSLRPVERKFWNTDPQVLVLHDNQ